MKTVIEFDLPDEREEYEIHVRAMANDRKLDEIDNFCRNKIKHSDLSDATENILETIREMIRESI